VTLAVTAHGAAVRFPVKVVPGAARERIAGLLGTALKIQVTAPPEHGKANAALCDLLARTLALPKSAVRVVQGLASPRKTVEVKGLEPAVLLARLGLST
jgi:uncharacterized protein (TIGR00251 family)